MPLIPQYYTHLQFRVIVQFRPRQKTDNSDDVFELEVSKRSTYDQFAARVAKHLSLTDPFKLRFFINTMGGDVPKHPIRRVSNATLQEIVTTNANQTGPLIVWYEKLDVSILELENMRTLSVTLLDGNLREKEVVPVMVLKTGKVGDLLAALKAKIPGVFPHRIYMVQQSRYVMDLSVDTPVGQINEYGIQLCVEVEKVPDEFQSSTASECKVIDVFHFHGNTTRTHSIPFQLPIFAGQTVKDILKRVQVRLGLSDKEVGSIRMALVQMPGGVAQYLDDLDEPLGSTILATHAIGLDHPDRSHHRRQAGVEKAIKIHG